MAAIRGYLTAGSAVVISLLLAGCVTINVQKPGAVSQPTPTSSVSASIPPSPSVTPIMAADGSAQEPQATNGGYSITGWAPEEVSGVSFVTLDGLEWFGSGQDRPPAHASFIVGPATRLYFSKSGSPEDLAKVSKQAFFRYLSNPDYREATPNDPNGRASIVTWIWAMDSRSSQRVKLATKVEANLIGE